MSFRFNWNFFDVDELQKQCQHVLTENIAKTKRPPVMVQPLQVVGIDFGTIPPELRFVSIDTVGSHRAHVVFALKYAGNASVSLATLVEANPLRQSYFQNFPEYVRPKVIGANSSLHLPFRLNIRHIELDSLVDVIYTRQGLVVNFRDEPVTALESESSLDMIPRVKKIVGNILRTQLGELFVEDIPETLWLLSTPDRQPPSPASGPRRWSQQHIDHVRFSSLAPIAAIGLTASQKEKRPYDTLSMSVQPIRCAIMSRASLSPPTNYHRTPSSIDLSDDPYLGLEGFSNIFEKAPSECSSSSGNFGQAQRVKPRRRVISIRKIIHREPVIEEPSPPLRTVPDGTTTTSSSGYLEPPQSSSTGPRTPILGATSSVGSAISSPVNSWGSLPPQTPPTHVQDTGNDFAISPGSDDIPLAAISAHFAPPEHRRFSSPDDLFVSMPTRRHSHRHMRKLRTTSLQERTKTPILGPPESSSPIHNSHQNRYSRTHETRFFSSNITTS